MSETCPDCDGEGFIVTCCDDLCVGGGHCIHGDGEDMCETCRGHGTVPDEDEPEWEDDE